MTIDAEWPEIVCLCGDVFTTTADMAMHLWMAHGHTVPIAAEYGTAVPTGFPVTDPDLDAPDGARMIFERHRGRWEPQCGKIAAALRGKSR